MSVPVLVLEFNELSGALLDRFIASGDLPNFRRLREVSDTWVTDAGEAEGERLNPWVQWVTVHTGLPAAEHGALLLGERVEVPVPTIADDVCAAGRSSLVFGSMNHPSPRPGFRGAWLPDPWALASTPIPGDLRPYYEFVRGQVQEHTNLDRSSSPRHALAFVRFLVRHGVRASTAAAVAGQLAGERTGRRGRWRRAIVLDRIQWDVFRHYHRRERPAFATFFSNSTAHLQHLYWRDMDPTGFEPWERDPGEGLASAVQSGYVGMDRIVGEAIELAGPNSAVVLCTALSQRANLTGEMLDRECFHRPRDFGRFVEALGLVGVREVAPVMAEEFHLLFEDEPAATGAVEALRRARVGDESAFAVRRTGDDVFVGCRLFTPQPTEAVLRTADGRSIPFAELLYQADAPRSGTHDPTGLLWVRHPDQAAGRDRGQLPLAVVTDVLRNLLGVGSGSANDASVVRRERS